ncbi:hypothetical protein HDU76_008212 [Blyttiomyces sp. JEL0837]|nr:hypothetical protein HDU76_008212 [Blyttiomyces sp. JEL0837]
MPTAHHTPPNHPDHQSQRDHQPLLSDIEDQQEDNDDHDLHGPYHKPQPMSLLSYIGICFSLIFVELIHGGYAVVQMLPVMTTFICAILGRENIDPFNPHGRLKLISIFIAVFGAMIIAGNPKSIPESPSTSALIFSSLHSTTTIEEPANITSWILGNILIFISCICFSIYFILAQDLLRIIPPITLTAWTYTGGFLWYIPVLFLTSTIPPTSTPTLPPLFSFPLVKGSLAILYAGVFGSAVAYGILNWATKRTSPPFVTVFVPLATITSAVLSAVFLKEEFGVVEGVGAVVVCVGVFGLVWTRWVEGKEMVLESERKKKVRGDGSGDGVVVVEDVDNGGEREREDVVVFGTERQGLLSRGNNGVDDRPVLYGSTTTASNR